MTILLDWFQKSKTSPVKPQYADPERAPDRAGLDSEKENKMEAGERRPEGTAPLGCAFDFGL